MKRWLRLKKFVYNLLWFSVFMRAKNVCKHINVYQSNRNQTNNSSPHRNIAKYYKENRNATMMTMKTKRQASFELNLINSRTAHENKHKIVKRMNFLCIFKFIQHFKHLNKSHKIFMMTFFLRLTSKRIQLSRCIEKIFNWLDIIVPIVECFQIAHEISWLDSGFKKKKSESLKYFILLERKPQEGFRAFPLNNAFYFISFTIFFFHWILCISCHLLTLVICIFGCGLWWMKNLRLVRVQYRISIFESIISILLSMSSYTKTNMCPEK